MSESNTSSTSSSCNSRHFSWLMKSCLPNDPHHNLHHPQPISTAFPTALSPISSLPDDLLLECLSRVPSSSLPSLSLVSRRWAHLLFSPSFPLLRRRLGLLHPTLFTISSAFYGSTAHAASLRIDHQLRDWKICPCPVSYLDSIDLQAVLSQARVVSIDRYVYLLSRYNVVRLDTWTFQLCSLCPMNFTRKKFAAAVVSGRIYVAGGTSRTSSVEEYDPERNSWRVVSHAPRKRYGCIGVENDGLFHVIGGLKIGASGVEAHVYASSMDLYNVGTRNWLRVRHVPDGGCVIGACAVAGYVYILASHAVELSFWRFHAERGDGTGGLGEWCRIKSPPLPPQVRLDSTVRFSFVGVGKKVILVQVSGCIDDLLRRSGRCERGLREGLVMAYDCVGGDWCRMADLPEVIRRAACVSVEC